MLAKLTQQLAIVLAIFLTACQKHEQQESDTLYGNAFSEITVGNQVKPGYRIEFPRDHLAHPDFAIEWWYLTANLFDDQGNQYPLQWTLFRYTGADKETRWQDAQQYLAHVKLSDKHSTWFEERFARGGVGNAAVKLDGPQNRFQAYIDDWIWHADAADLLPAKLTFSIEDKVSVDLHLSSQKNYVLHGDQGYSIKQGGSDHASMYYSQPFIDIQGELKLPTGNVSVSGQGWFDHEWSAQLTDGASSGWDWFSLHLQGNNKLMLFRVRSKSAPDSWFGTFIDDAGNTTALQPGDISASQLSVTRVRNKPLPLHWQISVPGEGVDINITPFKKDQWNAGMFSYYEGAVAVSGSHTGVGFIELTGY